MVPALQTTPALDNGTVAARLREVADLLHGQEASPYRVAAYRRAADTIAGLEEDVARLVRQGGMAALCALPGIDRALASVIEELVRSGRLGLLDRLRGTLDVEALFQTIPGVGPKLARLLSEGLHVDTLEALEEAAREGRLARLPGIGARRALALGGALALMLGRVRSRRPRSAPPTVAEPDVETLLDVDAEYRRRAAAGELPRIAPRRNNPTGQAWLPILHTQRGPWHLTALFSNTTRAHLLGRDHDWVIVYFHHDSEPERQRTVVTEISGPATGRRVVRGREDELA
jgi:hypothetical protein